MLGEGARGLTCATFILAVFNAMGVTLVDEGDWPVREEDDRAFLAAVAKFASPAHFAMLRAEVDERCGRIQPDEVLGACACRLPAKFDCTRTAADRVLERLAKALA